MQLKSAEDHWHKGLCQFDCNEVFNRFGLKWCKSVYKTFQWCLFSYLEASYSSNTPRDVSGAEYKGRQ